MSTYIICDVCGGRIKETPYIICDVCGGRIKEAPRIVGLRACDDEMSSLPKRERIDLCGECALLAIHEQNRATMEPDGPTNAVLSRALMARMVEALRMLRPVTAA